jgi:hypothetical protein
MELKLADTKILGADIMRVRLPRDIVMDVKSLRIHVFEMRLEPQEALSFFRKINSLAREQMKARGVSSVEIRKLLEPQPGDFSVKPPEPLSPRITSSNTVDTLRP